MDEQMKAALQAAYELMDPILQELLEMSGGLITDFRIRGYNPKSPNSPPRKYDLRFWTNSSIPYYDRDSIERLVTEVEDRIYPHIDMLRNIWCIAVALMPSVDHIMFTPKGGSLYRPLVACDDVDHNAPDISLFFD